MKIKVRNKMIQNKDRMSSGEETRIVDVNMTMKKMV